MQLPTLCNVPGCRSNGRYCRLHSTTPEKQTGKSIQVKTTLNQWFDKKIRNCKWICAECGAPCYSDDKTYQRAVQAHLLPKSLFPSIATHEDNHICLGVSCGCHSKYDHSWDSASKMKIWPVVFPYLAKLIHLIKPEEVKKLPDILRKEYDRPLRRDPDLVYPPNSYYKGD